VEVRVVAATNRDLRADVCAGKFREDLYYRLDVVQLRTASLRDRRSDIPDLADAFLGQLAEGGLPHCSLSPQGRAALVDFHWPGNVRQLRNVLEQAVIDSPTAIISAELLQRIISLSFAAAGQEPPGGYPAASEEPGAETAGIGAYERRPSPEAQGRATHGCEFRRNSPTDVWQTLEDLERQHIAQTLEHTFYNRSAAARLLGVTRQALLRKMKRYGMRS
jgi:DNA-binding NtrC family response regulator